MKRFIFIVTVLSCLAGGSCFFSPARAQDFTPAAKGQLIKHSYYTLSYMEAHEQAEWVYYELDAAILHAGIKRSNNFRPDPNVSSGSASLGDYKGSGYDRGHLAPAGDMNRSTTAMSESFFMSNMSPQHPSFNRGGWKSLESLVRNWAQEEGRLYVLTGPILNDKLGSIGANEVTVPAYYYKVVYAPASFKMIALKMPNEKINSPLPSYCVSVDALEEETGIDFFYQLEDSLEDQLEASTTYTAWNFESSGKPHPRTNTAPSTVASEISAPAAKAAVNSRQCKGTAKSTGVQCRNKTRQANGYCKLHQSQAPGVRVPL